MKLIQHVHFKYHEVKLLIAIAAVYSEDILLW